MTREELSEYSDRHYGHMSSLYVVLKDGTSVPYVDFLTEQTLTTYPDGSTTKKFTYGDKI